jgi:hypothetical protein
MFMPIMVAGANLMSKVLRQQRESIYCFHVIVVPADLLSPGWAEWAEESPDE